MKIFDLFAMCVRNLFRRKFRTFLTIMGVVIGTCAIVVTISLGIGINASQEAFLEGFGDLTVIEVYPRGGDDLLLNDDAIATFLNIPGVEAATPFYSYSPENGYLEIQHGKKNRFTYWYGSWGLKGVYPEALEALNYDIAQGEMFKPGSKTPQVVFGSMAAYEFYITKTYEEISYYGVPAEERPDPFFDPFEGGIHLTLTNYGDNNGNAGNYTIDLEVVGILSEDISDRESQYAIYMHIDDLKQIREDYEKNYNIKVSKEDREKEEYDQVKVKCFTIKDVSSVYEQLDAMEYSLWSMDTWRQNMEEQTNQIQMILGMLGAVSLFVAAISITNTMIMSVYERTREIGVMKVLGCLVSNIRTIFLTEAGLIGFFGGILGIGTSFLLSYLLNEFGGSISSALGGFAMEGTKVSIIPIWLAGVGMVFSTLIGLVSGFTPANRAVKISALEAIKTE